MYRKKIFFRLLPVRLYYCTNDTTYLCTKIQPLYTKHIYMYNISVINCRFTRCRMKECPMMHKQLSLPQTKKNKITSHEIVFCCTGFSMKKKILTTRSNEECTCFHLWLKKRFFPFSQFDAFSGWHQVITTCPCMVFIF